LPVTAKTEGALAAATTQLAEHLNQQPDTNLVDVAYTLQVGRTHHPVRSAILCRTLDDAKQALAARTGFRRVVTGDAPSVVFLFPGQGSQYTSMSRDLY
jgi:acyl transferase domain-containing protein